MTKKRTRTTNIKYRLPEELQSLVGIKPWLDPSGKRLALPLMQLLTPYWDKRTWKQYLDSYESPQIEKCVPTDTWEALIKKTTESIFENVPEPVELELVRDVDFSVKILPSFHRQVVRMAFWQNMSIRSIAMALILPKSVVHRMVKDAKQTLRALIKQPVGQFATYEGLAILKTTKERENDQDVSA